LIANEQRISQDTMFERLRNWKAATFKPRRSAYGGEERGARDAVLARHVTSRSCCIRFRA